MRASTSAWVRAASGLALAGRPSASRSACSMMSSAAPVVNPSKAVGEMKWASAPSRSVPMVSCISPTPSVTASARPM